MKALRAMGFTDNAKNLQVLQSTDGDVPNAIEILCRIGQGPVTSTLPAPSRSNTTNNNNNSRTPARSSSNTNNNSSSADPKEKILWNMGFHDSALNKEALRRAGGNPEVAAGILIDDKDKLAKAVRDNASSNPPALPNRLEPPNNIRNNNNNNNKNQADNLLLDLSTPEDNQQQQQQQLLLMQQQQMQRMQMQNAFGNNNNNNNNNQQFGNTDQFGMVDSWLHILMGEPWELSRRQGIARC